MSKLRIGSIMKFDSTKSRKEAYNCGKKQGAVEELTRIRNYIYKNSFKKNEYSIRMSLGRLDKRLKQLKEEGVEK
jgi:hypothetical protein